MGGERVGCGLGVGVLQGIGSVGEDRAVCSIAADGGVFAVGQAVAADDQGLDAEIGELAGQEAAFGMITAEVDDFGAFSLEAGSSAR